MAPLAEPRSAQEAQCLIGRTFVKVFPGAGTFTGVIKGIDTSVQTPNGKQRGIFYRVLCVGHAAHAVLSCAVLPGRAAATPLALQPHPVHLWHKFAPLLLCTHRSYPEDGDSEHLLWPELSTLLAKAPAAPGPDEEQSHPARKRSRSHSGSGQQQQQPSEADQAPLQQSRRKRSRSGEQDPAASDSSDKQPPPAGGSGGASDADRVLRGSASAGAGAVDKDKDGELVVREQGLAGHIWRLRVVNFMCHRDFAMDFGCGLVRHIPCQHACMAFPFTWQMYAWYYYLADLCLVFTRLLGTRCAMS